LPAHLWIPSLSHLPSSYLPSQKRDKKEGAEDKKLRKQMLKDAKRAQRFEILLCDPPPPPPPLAFLYPSLFLTPVSSEYKRNSWKRPSKVKNNARKELGRLIHLLRRQFLSTKVLPGARLRPMYVSM
jgi:hypothetical protein